MRYADAAGVWRVETLQQRVEWLRQFAPSAWREIAWLEGDDECALFESQRRTDVWWSEFTDGLRAAVESFPRDPW
jgi:hypothetical protein